MGWVVIQSFSDASDNLHQYRTGDIYPRDGVEGDKNRALELSGQSNKAGKPLIEWQKPKRGRKKDAVSD